MEFYLLTMVGVYDRGPLGIFTNINDAKQYAEELYGKSDGYHSFRVDCIKLDRRLKTEVDLIRYKTLRHSNTSFTNMFDVRVPSYEEL